MALFIFWPRPIAADIHPNQQLTVDDAGSQLSDCDSARTSKTCADRLRFPLAWAIPPNRWPDYSRLDRLASRNGFILVYPAALKSMWATIDAAPDNLDANPDIRFFDQLLNHLSRSHDIDQDRVYAVGMSNGASLVQLLAIARSDDVAAIVAHSGSQPRDLGSSNNRLPIMLIVGADDPSSRTIQSDADQYRSNGTRRCIRFCSGVGT